MIYITVYQTIFKAFLAIRTTIDSFYNDKYQTIVQYNKKTQNYGRIYNLFANCEL